MRERLGLFMIAVVFFSIPYSGLDHDDLLSSEVSDRIGLTFMTCSVLFAQAMNTIPLVQRQRLLVYHEMNMGFYKVWEQYASLSVMVLVLFALPSSIIAYFMAWGMGGMRDKVGYWIFGWTNAFILTAFGEMLALFYGMYFVDVLKAMTAFISVFVTIFVPCSGLLIATTDIAWPMQIFAYLNPLRYGAASDIINQFEGRSIVQDSTYVTYEDGDDVIDYLGYDSMTGSKVGNDLIILIACVMIAVSGYATTRYLVSKSMMGNES